MLEPRKELPGDVMAALREIRGHVRSVTAFAELLGWSYDTLHRLEGVRWNTVEEEWERPVDVADLQPLVNAGLITQGDEFWMRFQGAFTWQHIIMQYGRQAYDEETLHARFLAPVLDEHAIALVRAVAEHEVQNLLDKGVEIDDTQRELLVQRVVSEVVFRLATTGLILTKEVGGPFTPDAEQTRALFGAITSPAGDETPYMRTLRMVYEWAEQGFRQASGKSDLD